MREKYELCELQICPFERLEINGIPHLKPLRNEYPYRLCIFDRNNGIAIDVMNNYSYEYIEMSVINFYGTSYKKIKGDNRYAILRLPANSLCEVNGDVLNRAKEIRKKLEQGFDFENGNVISNKEYLEMISIKNVKKRIKKR